MRTVPLSGFFMVQCLPRRCGKLRYRLVLLECYSLSLTLIQDGIPDDQVVVGLKIYSDKTDFGRWTSQTAWPVLGFIVNLAQEVQNSSHYGGVTVLGYLPKVWKQSYAHFTDRLILSAGREYGKRED